MDTSKLTPLQRQVRSAVRAFLMTATRAELIAEEQIRKTEDPFRSSCVREMIDKWDAEGASSGADLPAFPKGSE